MIFKTLFVISLDSNSIIKEYIFNKQGVNIILGEKRENNDETNGVGKSTMIDCLSFLLGKTIPKYYSDNEILLKNNIFVALEIEKNNNSFFIGRSFNDPRFGYVSDALDSPPLEIDEWKKQGITEYKKYIEKLIIKEPQELREDITFAALREYIIRDEKTGFNDILLPNRGSLKQYMLLNYLFMMPYLSEKRIKSYKDIIDKINNEIKVIESMNINITALKVKEEELLGYIHELDHTIEHAKTTLHYNKNIDVYSEVKKDLNLVQNQIFEYEHICNQYQKNIDNLREKVLEIKQLENVEKFYEDLVGYFPEDVKENYTKVKEFYDFMVESRGNYFESKISSIQSNLKELYPEKDKLEFRLEELSKIFKSDNYVDDISIIMDNKRKTEVKLAEVKIRINDYNRKSKLAEEINDVQSEVLRINSMNFDEYLSNKENKIKIQTIFNELMESTYNQHGFLEFEYDNRIGYSSNSTTGRIKISCSIPDERSHGRLHMKINMFDLTWFLNRASSSSDISFLIHDGSYSNPDPYIKGTLLEFLHEKLLGIKNGQYFVTANQNELLKEDIEKFENKKMIVAKLDRLNNEKNRFFGFKF